MTPEERKAKAADRARRYREKAKARKQGKSKEELESEKKEQEQKSKEEKERLDNERKIKVANLEDGLRVALSGTISTVATGIHSIALRKTAPQLGQKRADTIAALWAPLLAPKLADSDMKNLPMLLAIATTSGVLIEWVAEISDEAKTRVLKEPAKAIKEAGKNEA